MSQSVDRALSILPLLAEGPAGLEQVATRLDVHKSTALRLLRTLHEHGLVHRQQDQRYRLGTRLFALAQQAVETLDIRETAHPHLAALGERTGHTVHLAVYEQGEVVYIDKVDSRYPVRMYSRIGRPVAITVAAVAKLLLADLPESERRAVAERLEYPRYTPRSTPDAAAFLAELARVREQGWATDLGGHEESINCLGAPLRGPDGRVHAAMSLSAPNVVASAEELLRLRPHLLRTAAAISAELSGTAPLPASASATQGRRKPAASAPGETAPGETTSGETAPAGNASAGPAPAEAAPAETGAIPAEAAPTRPAPHPEHEERPA